MTERDSHRFLLVNTLPTGTVKVKLPSGSNSGTSSRDQKHIPLFTVGTLPAGTAWCANMSLNKLERQKSKQQNTWQQVKHAKLYSDLVHD